eukprot:1526864-Pyramimonas_sp.AAC.1
MFYFQADSQFELSLRNKHTFLNLELYENPGGNLIDGLQRLPLLRGAVRHRSARGIPARGAAITS